MQNNPTMENEAKYASISLLESSRSSTGTASSAQTLANIIVSIFGTGVLGLPFAFKNAGVVAATVGILIAGIATYYCMLILVECREKFKSEDEEEEEESVKTYGDLGYKCMGRTGRCITEFLILASQCGGSVAYLVFIGQNLSSIFKIHSLTYDSYIFLLIPIEIALSCVRTLSALAPFSIFADVCNAAAMVIVLKSDIRKLVAGRETKGKAFSLEGLLFAAGMGVFCFEGLAMTLAIERSMRERKKFPRVLTLAIFGLMVLYIIFGLFGYMAYGDRTMDIITLNLPHDWTATVVKIGLCLALMFTFPIMVHPIHEIVEGNLKENWWFRKLSQIDDDNNSTTISGKFGIYISRAVVVVGLAVLASEIPGFGIFVSLVGSTVCALISFVLPATFHLLLLGSSLCFWQRALDFCVLVCGLLFAAYGAYMAVIGVYLN